MGNLNFLFTFYLILGSISFVYTQDVTFNSQIDLDNFDPAITTINGDLVINDSYTGSITDLSNLSNITSLAGDLEIRFNTELLNLNGLSNLTTIGGDLWISKNEKLEHIDGLSNLNSIGEDLRIGTNIKLEHIDGLSSIINVLGDLKIQYNNELQNLDGLINLTTIGGDLWISKNGFLQNLYGLSNLISVTNNISIFKVPNLQNIDALSNLTHVGGGVSFSGNPSLQNIDGLFNVLSIGAALYINDNDNLQNLDGLSNLTSIVGDLIIQDNLVLSNCCGIEPLLNTPNGVGGYIDINNNPFPCNSQANLITECNPTNISELYVDNTAQGNNTGVSWINAFTDLQDALAIGTEKTIHIAEGTYSPTSIGGLRGETFLIPNGTILKGGYPSGGGNQNTDLYETILSGNIDASTTDGDSYHVVTIKDVDNIELNGLTIRDGNADNANSFGRSRGGGLYIINSELELKNVEVKWNKGIRGGGLFASNSDVTIRQSTFKNNRADYGGALFYSLGSNLDLLRSQVINNTSNNRCALEANNASSTEIKNSIIANNSSTNTNALGITATTRDATIQISNSTILGETKNENLITYLVGNNDQLDVTINNSIIAHQNPSFDKNMIAYNNNILNLNHSNCYFSGSSTIGNGTNMLFADIDGDLMLNSDYSLNECSPVVDSGDDALGTGSQDYFGNPRYFSTIDIGAYEAQITCANPMRLMSGNSKELNVSLFPNPAKDEFTLQVKGEEELLVRIYDSLSREVFQGEMENELEINTSEWLSGFYHVVLVDDSGRIGGSYNILVQK